jgi:antitoxin (DNA-binding transcriptional repressor) of toxin-antitoxin stability system
MCYMSAVGATSARRLRPSGKVGVRELRQNLSIYLVRIAAGETLEVTDRGRSVAVLAPLPPAATLVQKLVASGRATAATGAGLPPFTRLPSRAARGLGERVQKALQASREDAV